jgi:hypothetical protein
MLKHLLPYSNTFDVFIQTHCPRAVGEPLLLSDDPWYVAEKILVFLELFYDSTCVLSGVYYPTSSLIGMAIGPVGMDTHGFRTRWTWIRV